MDAERSSFEHREAPSGQGATRGQAGPGGSGEQEGKPDPGVLGRPVSSRELLEQLVQDPARLQALHSTELVMDLDRGAFDRLARLAARVTRAPVALVSLVEAERQVLAGAVGLPEPWASRRETPLTYSFCQHVVGAREALVVDDARAHAALREEPAVVELGVTAYAGFPLFSRDGQVLGTLCALDAQPRPWTEDQRAALADLAELATNEIQARTARRRAERAEADAVAARDRAEAANAELQAANRDLAAVVRVTRALAHEPDARLAICETALEVADAACVLLLEPTDRDTLAVSAAVGTEIDDFEVALEVVEATALPPFRTGRSRLVVNTSSDPTLAADPLVRMTGSRSLLLEPVLAGGATLGLLAVGWNRHVDALAEDAVRLVGLLVDDAAIAIERAQLADRLSAANRIDHVTGLANLRALEDELTRELVRCKRLEHPLCLALLELEDVEAFAEQEGPEAADHLLALIAEGWRGQVREVDLLARCQDQRFGLMLPACSLNAAVDIAERLRTASAPRTTCAIGIAAWDEGEDEMELMARVEDALRQARRAGPDATVASVPR